MNSVKLFLIVAISACNCFSQNAANLREPEIIVDRFRANNPRQRRRPHDEDVMRIVLEAFLRDREHHQQAAAVAQAQPLPLPETVALRAPQPVMRLRPRPRPQCSDNCFEKTITVAALFLLYGFLFRLLFMSTDGLLRILSSR